MSLRCHQGEPDCQTPAVSLQGPGLKLAAEDKFLTDVFLTCRACNLIFLKDQMKRLKTEFPNSKERFIKVSQQWKGLSNREKESYRAKLNKKILDYQIELQKWFQVQRILPFPQIYSYSVKTGRPLKVCHLSHSSDIEARRAGCLSEK